MTQPASTPEILPPFETLPPFRHVPEQRIDPSVVVGMRVSVARIMQLVTELGHDPDRTVSVHVDPASVTVVTAYQEPLPEGGVGPVVLVTTEHRIER